MAKKGVLKRDSTLRDAISNMRSAVTSYVSGKSSIPHAAIGFKQLIFTDMSFSPFSVALYYDAFPIIAVCAII